MADPVLKWAGGKRRLLTEIYERFPDDDMPFKDRTYHEPFFGGGAVFFDLEPAQATVNDTNERLINFYRQIRANPQKVLDRADEFKDPESDPNPNMRFDETNRRGREIKGYYYQQRERFNNRPRGDEYDEIEEAALLLYLNRTCFNGLYRENNSGGFNVPIGRYSDPEWVMDDLVTEAGDVLDCSGVDILNKDFEYILEKATAGDVVYFDPPYKPMSATANFTDYSADGFDQDDQERLLKVASELDEMEVHVILSNSGVLAERYKGADFTVGIEGAKRYINSDADGRGEVDEIIATNVPQEPLSTPSK